MPLHYDFRKGKRVRVLFKDGRPALVGRFVERSSKKVVLENARIPFREIRAIVIEDAQREEVRKKAKRRRS